MNYEQYIQAVVWGYKNGDSEIVGTTEMLQHIKDQFKIDATTDDLQKIYEEHEMQVADDIIDEFYRVSCMAGYKFVDVDYDDDEMEWTIYTEEYGESDDEDEDDE